MGFFSNLKNAVTGGAATVAIDVPSSAARGDTIPIKVSATAKSAADAKSVYVIIRASEHAELRDTDYSGGRSTTEVVHGQRTSFEHKLVLATGVKLAAGQTGAWEGAFQIPTQTNPTYQGQIIRHVWQIQAGLEMTGNDPDSGWQTIQVA